MQQTTDYQLYRTIIQRVVDNEEQLPSLPSITLKIRKAIQDPNADITLISKLVRLDPSLSTLLLKYAASPIYLRQVPPKTIEATLAMIGLPALESLVMTHSVKSLFILKNPELKKLFKLSWERMIYKAATSQLLAKKLGFRPTEEIMTASMLSEVGTLAILSAFGSDVKVPQSTTYYELCRRFSKPLSTILLRKWGLEDTLVKITQSTGNWSLTGKNADVTILDVINLAIYSTVQHLNAEHDLPPLEDLRAYEKLPPALSILTQDKKLMMVQDNLETIDRIIASIS